MLWQSLLTLRLSSKSLVAQLPAIAAHRPGLRQHEIRTGSSARNRRWSSVLASAHGRRPWDRMRSSGAVGSAAAGREQMMRLWRWRIEPHRSAIEWTMQPQEPQQNQNVIDGSFVL